MEDIRKKAKELLEQKTVNLVVGYAEGFTKGTVKAFFAKDSKDADKLIYDDRCIQNLAVYLTKHEVKHYGKIAIVSPIQVLRGILQIASECQVEESNLVILGISNDKKLLEFPNFKTVEEYLAKADLNYSKEEQEIIAKLDAMTMEERWKFWQNEFSKCIRCYACRSSCPMCYCIRCMAECNTPQWIPVGAHEVGNFDWHVMRAMHLAGRCVNCGDCAKACPVDIPLNLLTYKLIDSIKSDFDTVAGVKSSMESVLSTYKPNDKEQFIL